LEKGGKMINVKKKKRQIKARESGERKQREKGAPSAKKTKFLHFEKCERTIETQHNQRGVKELVWERDRRKKTKKKTVDYWVEQMGAVPTVKCETSRPPKSTGW